MADEKLTPQEQVVKNYLEKQVEQDEALKTVYVPSKIKDCFKYITSLAKEKAVGGCAMVEDAVVFKWARDYYLEELPKNADKKTVTEVQTKSNEVVEKKEVTVIKSEPQYDSEKNGLLFDL